MERTFVDIHILSLKLKKDKKVKHVSNTTFLHIYVSNVTKRKVLLYSSNAIILTYVFTKIQ